MPSLLTLAPLFPRFRDKSPEFYTHAPRLSTLGEKKCARFFAD